jgi:hypothetical protein
VSLILEALRKLEREKQAPERGFLVLGTGAWVDRGGVVRPIVLFVLGLLAGGAALGIVMMRTRPAAVAVVEPAPAATPPPSAIPVASSMAPMPATTASPTTAQFAPAGASPAAAAPSPRVFTLQAISEKDGHTVALINDRLLREGDAIDGARVITIAADSVELEIGGRRVVLRF